MTGMILRFACVAFAAPFVVLWLGVTRQTHRADDIGIRWRNWVAGGGSR